MDVLALDMDNEECNNSHLRNENKTKPYKL